MGGLKIDIEDLPEIKAAFEALPAHVRKNAMAEALEPASAIIRDAIVSRANFGRYSTGALKASIESRMTRIAGDPSAVVVPSRKRRAGGHHAHLVEFGTAPHGGHPGTRPQPFFVPGIEASEARALDVMEKILLDAIAAHWGDSE